MNYYIKRIASLIMCVVMVVSLCSCSVVQALVSTVSTTTTTQATAPLETKKPSNSEHSLVYKSLTEKQKDVYNQLSKQVGDRDKVRYRIKNCNEKDLLAGYKAYQLDNPQYMWLASGYAYSTFDKKNYKVTPNLFGKGIADYWSMYDEVEMAVKDVVDAASELPTDYEKALYVHDYLAEHTKYDFDALDQLNKDGFETKDFYPASTAYGVFHNNIAVCSGFSSAFQIIMTKLNIECGTVSGAKDDGSSHGWNYVNLDGDYYYIDVTWDLPSSDNSNNDGGLVSHTYFCITTDELLYDHAIADEEVVPDCIATRLNYFVYNDLYLESYDFFKASKIIKSQKGDEIYIKFGSEDEAKRAQKDLIDKRKIFVIMPTLNSIVWYQNNCVLYISKE